jgi:molybdopterin-binding protein
MAAKTKDDTEASWLRLGPAARALGVSYPTLKQWIYQRKIRAAKTPGGHYRIAPAEILRLTRGGNRAEKPKARMMSPRNKLAGRIESVRMDGLLAQVELDVGGQRVCAIITRDSARELGLKRGMAAYAVMKATEVMIARD